MNKILELTQDKEYDFYLHTFYAFVSEKWNYNTREVPNDE